MSAAPKIRSIAVGPVTLTIACAALALLPASAQAYNCRVPALIDPVKKAVCAQPLLAGMDRDENTRRAALTSKLSIDSRRIVIADRRDFVATRDKCGSDIRCLEATYRAQLRLYGKIDTCARRQAPQQTFCVSRATQQHREELHKSM